MTIKLFVRCQNVVCGTVLHYMYVFSLGLHVHMSDFIHWGGHFTTSIGPHHVIGRINHIELIKGLKTPTTRREGLIAPLFLCFQKFDQNRQNIQVRLQHL